MKRLLVVLALLFSAGAYAQVDQAQFDHAYGAWDALLHKHVHWLADQKQSRVDYAALKGDRAALQQVLGSFSEVPASQFEGWSEAQRMAFLINAYNAFTLELVLGAYPELKSIKGLGSFFSSPWRKKFFTLLGEPRHLDWIEHEQLRPRYADPRVHVVLNCAAIGCPALRNEAYTASKLDAQLEDGFVRFMGDRTRNRVKEGRLEVSAVFKWFGEDFERGHKGFSRREDVYAKYAPQLTDNAAEQARLRARAMPATYVDYDWSLNAVGR